MFVLTNQSELKNIYFELEPDGSVKHNYFVLVTETKFQRGFLLFNLPPRENERERENSKKDLFKGFSKV